MKTEVGGFPGIHDPVPFLFLTISPCGKMRSRSGGTLCVNGRFESGLKRGIIVSFNMPGGSFLYPHPVPMVEPSRSFRRVIDFGDLSPNEFEKLVFRYLEAESRYNRVEWLQSTNSGDAGRDLSAMECGTRIAIQAKHWIGSIGQNIIHDNISPLMTWLPPFKKLLFITSGTFTQGAIRYMEANNSNRNASMEIELWSGDMFKAKLAGFPKLLPHG